MASNELDIEVIQTLMHLGLTCSEATIYLTLVKLRKSGAKKIANMANIARPDVYRIMPCLEQLGLAEKILAKPIEYKATPLKNGYQILLQNKSQEFIELKDKTIDLIENTNDTIDKGTLPDEEQNFVLISSKTLHQKNVALECAKTRYSLDVIDKWGGLWFQIFYRHQIHIKALKRGVKIRIITEKHDGFLADKIPVLLNNNPLFEIRYITSPIPIRAEIYDGKKVDMSTKPANDTEVTPSLWSNNQQFVKLMTAYFEETWEKAELPKFLAKHVIKNRC